MARKKEADLITKNRAKILKAAKELFIEVGINQPQMNEIARKAGMSKSTLYVYFTSKEEIINYITKEAMTYLYEQMVKVQELNISDDHQQYMKICFALVEFKKKYSLSFEALVERISIDQNDLADNNVLMEIYQIGEQVNQLIMQLFTKNRKDIDKESLLKLVFTQWGSIYGLIMLADNKQDYIRSSMNLTKQQFLEQGFEQLYHVLEYNFIVKKEAE